MMHTNSSPWKSITSIYQTINKTPEKKVNTDHFINNSGSPLPQTFKFTPTKGKKMYPSLNPPDQNTSRRLTLNSSPIHNNQNVNESYINKDNQSFVSAMDTLQTQMFSSNISNKVINEFSSRYEKVRDEKINNIVELNNNTTNEELNRRASDRFSLNHRTRFNRMESIAFHYAAMRKERKESIQRKLISDNDLLMSEPDIVEENQIQTMTPGDKRLNFKPLESASKRMKLDDELNFKEITVLDSSPTKSINQKENLKKIYQGRLNNESQNMSEHLPSYLQPTKASLQKSSSSKSLSPSKSSTSLKLGGTLYPTPTLNPNTPLLATKQSTKMSRSPSISPQRSLSKLSPSKAYSNLNKILTSSPTKEDIGTPSQIVDEDQIIKEQFKNPTRIPRSKTINNVKHNNNNNNNKEYHSMLPRSNTSGSVRNTGMSSSSSIPRLASLNNVESKVESKLKKWRY